MNTETAQTSSKEPVATQTPSKLPRIPNITIPNAPSRTAEDAEIVEESAWNLGPDGMQLKESEPEPEPAFKDTAVLERALEIGFTEEDIKEFSPKQLARAVAIAESRAELSVTAPAPAPHDEKKPPPSERFDFDAWNKGRKSADQFAPENVDPLIIDVIKALDAYWAEKIESQKQERAADAAWAKLDSEFETINPSVGGLFGSGPTSNLDHRSKEFKARQEVVARTDAILAASQRNGKKIDFKTAFRQSVASLHADDIAKTKGQDTKAKAKARQEQMIHRPASANSQRKLNSTESAINLLTAKMRDWGVL